MTRLCALLLMGGVATSALAGTLRGTVSDASSKEPIPFATVATKPGGASTATDANGNFSLTLADGEYTVTISFIGYKTQTHRVKVQGMRRLNVSLQEDSHVLGEVVVTAKESTGLTSTSRIDRDAMEHLQPTSFTDLLELLPGNISADPDMGSVNSIKLRETGTLGATGTASTSTDYNITSLGTLFMVDGAPINGDANMQNVPNASSDRTSPEFKKDMTNKGVDMRAISTDNIESVEVVRGIPSAEYGNLTTGMVNIKRIRRATPLTARFKADEYSKLFSVGKGFYLPGTGHIVNVDAGYLDSKVDPRDNLENYKRLNVSARLNLKFERKAHTLAWIAGVDYTGSFDNTKTDPDLSYTKVNEYKSRYNRFNFTSDLNIAFHKIKWLQSVNLNTSASYQHDRLERHKQVAPQRASVAPTSMEEGEHDGQYLLSEYIADYVSDGKPLNIFVKAKAEGRLAWRELVNAYKVGMEWTLSKNYGDGQVYDLTKPLSASWTTRPRAYKDIPALNVLSFYAEDNITLPVGNNKAELQLGLRTIQLPGLDKQYYLSGKVYVDPRLNGKWTFPDIHIGKRTLKIFLAGGYGLTTKMPTIAYLYPQVNYNDFIQLNYYDVNDPVNLSRINLRTYIDQVANYQLKPARNHKWEIRLGFNFGHNSLQITYFNEKLRSGFRYSSVYQPYTYREYDVSAIDATTLTAPPSLENLPYTERQILDGHSIVTNGSRLDKQGIELTLSTARWQPLATALTITGAWFRSTYTNSQMMYSTVSDVVDNRAVSDYYVGLYDWNDGRINQQLNTNFMFDTQIKRWGLVFTTTLQCMWFVTTKKMWQNGVPVSYISAEDGQLHTYTEAMQSDAVLQFLVKTYNDAVYNRQTVPTALYLNLKATKTIGKHIKAAVFVNRILDYLPDYTSNGLTVRRTSDPYFGMELNFSL